MAGKRRIGRWRICSRRHIRRCGLAGIGLLLAGCSSAGVSGEAPAGPRLLTEHERATDCRQLTHLVNQRITSMKSWAAQITTQRDLPPATLSAMLSRTFGPKGAGNLAIEKYDDERRKAEALNGQLAAKGCATVDIDKELGDAKDKIAQARKP